MARMASTEFGEQKRSILDLNVIFFIEKGTRGLMQMFANVNGVSKQY